MTETYGGTALRVLEDLVAEVMGPKIGLDDQQRLYNATRAALDLGCNADAIAEAMKAGAERAGYLA